MDEYSDHRAIGSLIGKYGSCPPCHGNCSQGRHCPSSERQEPLPPPFTAEEHLQTVQSAWNGPTVSLAIVCAIMIGVLVVHAAARAGWL